MVEDQRTGQSDDTAYSVVWAPQQGPQTALISCPIFEVFFGGARGGGKTDGMLGDFIRHASLYGENAIGLMIRRELTQLIEAIERSKQIYASLGWTYNEQQKMWRAPNGARLRFAYLERDSDADAYQGHSYTRIYVEELGTFPSPAPIMKLMATLRSGAGVPCGFRATGNPGGPGHQWVRERYIDPCREGMKIIRQNFENPWNKKVIVRERVFIPSQLTHNKYLGEDYVANLQMAGSASLVRAWLEGDWNIVDGAFFDCWSNAKHIVRPFEVPKDWTRFRAMDWGSAKPFSVGWYAIVGDDYQIEDGPKLPRGCLVQYREWYGVKLKEGGGFEPNVGLKLTAEDVAAGIKQREQDDVIAYGVIDPAAFSSDGGPSIAERMLRQGIAWRPADNKRIPQNGAMGGWDQMRSRLKGDTEDHPMLVFMTNCAHAIRTIPAMQHDSTRPEDMDSDGEDHCFAAGTLVMTNEGLKPIETLPECGIVASKDGWRAYRSARLVARKQEVVRLKFSDGFEVICTPDHKFLNSADKWIDALDFIDETSYVSVCKQPSFRSQFRNLTASVIIGAAHTFKEKAFGYIAWFGKPTMGKFQTVITSTIRTMTAQIIRSKTLSAFLPLNIYLPVTALPAGSERYNIWMRPCVRQKNGTPQTKVCCGTSSTMTVLSSQFSLKRLMQFASIAENIIGLQKLKPSMENSAATTARPVRCVSVERLPAKADVFCLTVPSCGNFALANGIVVSNCADQTRYAVMSRPWVRTIKIETPTRPNDKYSKFKDTDSWRTA